MQVAFSGRFSYTTMRAHILGTQDTLFSASLYDLDDAPAAPVAGDPKVPPLVDGEGGAQDEGQGEDGGERGFVPP